VIIQVREYPNVEPENGIIFYDLWTPAADTGSSWDRIDLGTGSGAKILMENGAMILKRDSSERRNLFRLSKPSISSGQ
jgi:hypothetical protein